MNKKLSNIFNILISSILGIYLYTFLHEGGHALVGIIYNGKVDNMVLGLGAHVNLSGTKFSPAGQLLFNLAGVLMPVIILIISAVLYNPKIRNSFYHIFHGVFYLTIIGSLLAWIIIPIISLFKSPPTGDDTTKFMNGSGLNPLFIAITAFFFFVILIYYIHKKGIIMKVIEINKIAS